VQRRSYTLACEKAEFQTLLEKREKQPRGGIGEKKGLTAEVEKSKRHPEQLKQQRKRWEQDSDAFAAPAPVDETAHPTLQPSLDPTAAHRALQLLIPLYIISISLFGDITKLAASIEFPPEKEKTVNRVFGN